MHDVALVSLIPLFLVLATNAVQRRFWCRDLCPLGGMLALLSKAPGLRRVVNAEACTSCGRCAKACPTSAMDRDSAYVSDPSECTVCMACVTECPSKANSFKWAAPSVKLPAYREERRDALVAAGATGAGLAVAALPIARSNDPILRPPSTDETRLSELCVRCGACYSHCPTGVLRPSVSFNTVAGPWTPMLDARPAHCTLNCNRCAKGCPTDALHTPTIDERISLGLGAYATVDRTRCRAWARGHECMLCQGACPISGAIVGIDRPANLPKPRGFMAGGSGATGTSINVPVVNEDLCVGCDECKRVCPEAPFGIGVGVGPNASTASVLKADGPTVPDQPTQPNGGAGW